MSLPVIAIRPEPGCSATVAAGRAQGLAMQGVPLMEIHARRWEPPAEKVDALLLGSANAVRHAGASLAPFRGCSAYAVGEATAAAARDAGLTVVATGTGGLQSLLDQLPGPMRLLRLAGEEHLPLRPPPGISIDTRVAYAAEPLPMPAELAHTLGEGAVVLLHSAAAARHFAGECDRLGVPRTQVTLAALGPRILEAAGEGWQFARAAQDPSEAALLALAADLCHASPRREG
jgi:uroporphyrinogen-III synthase